MNNNTIFKIKSDSSFSGKGALWEYFHCLIEFCPRILYHCYSNTLNNLININIILPKHNLIFNHSHPDNINRTMKHIIDIIFDNKINFIYLETEKLNYPIIPFIKKKKKFEGEDIWCTETINYYSIFQKYIWNKFVINSVIKNKIILIIKRGIQKNCTENTNYDLKNGKERRSLENTFFDEIKLYLVSKNKNYNIVELENLPFQEQVNLFYKSKVVIGIHGGGLSNIIFCEKGTHIIELGERLVPCYKNLSEKIDLNYNYLNTKNFEDCKNLLNKII